MLADLSFLILMVLKFLGQPVAWCISDRENCDVIEIFFESIKARSPDTAINVLMTDDGIV